MTKNILFFSIALLPLVALSSEPSAFGGGKSDDNAPYTITSSDKINNTPIKQIDTTAQQSSSDTSEQFEGVRSIMDGYGTKIAKMEERIRTLEKANDELRSEFNQNVADNIKIQNEDREKIKVVLTEIGSLIDSINKNYVPKDKFDQLANEVRGKSSTKTNSADTTKKDSAKEKPVTSKELSSKDSATLIKEADTLAEKKSYNEAKVLYNELLHRNYKPAKVNFELGEIAYMQKSYSAAIEHYKTSISLFDKATYTPTLLYHTGSSFDKLGKKKEAQAFYKALKDGYPTSAEAKKVK